MKKASFAPDSNVRFYKVFKSTGLTQKDFGEFIGLSQNQVSNILSGNRGITPMLAELLKTKLNINPKWLIENKEPMMIDKPIPEFPLIPFFDNIPDGPWRDWFDSSTLMNCDSYIAMPKDLIGKHFIAIRVTDESMEPLLHKGEILIIDFHKKFRDGLMVVRHHRGHTIRNVYKKSKRKYYLCPLNFKYKVEEITVDNNTHFYVPVKVISVRDIS